MLSDEQILLVSNMSLPALFSLNGKTLDASLTRYVSTGIHIVCLPSTGRFKGNQFMVITGAMKNNVEKYWEADGESGEAERPEVEN